jgi:hypothetical protein
MSMPPDFSLCKMTLNDHWYFQIPNAIIYLSPSTRLGTYGLRDHVENFASTYGKNFASTVANSKVACVVPNLTNFYVT